MAISRILIVVVIAFASLHRPSAVASTGQSPSAYGWWWRAQPRSGPSVPPPPDVPNGGIYVASDPLGPSAISALRFTLAPEVRAERIELKLAATQGSPRLRACRATAPWSSSHGGSLEDAPTHDCKTAITEVVDADASHVTFALGSLQSGELLDVVIAPAPDDGGTYGVFSAAFDPPTADTLVVSSPATSDTDDPLPAPHLASTARRPATVVARSDPGPTFPLAVGALPEELVPVLRDALAAAAPVVTATQGGLAAGGRRFDIASPLAFVALLACIGVMLRKLGVQRRLQHRLVPVGGGPEVGERTDTESSTPPRLRGLGSFARVREGRAPRV